MTLTWSRGKGKEKPKRTQETQGTRSAMGWWGYLNASCGQTGQTGPGDRSDRSEQQNPCTQSRSTTEFLSSTRSLCCDAATLMKIRSAVLEDPRNPGRWPVLRKSPKLHARKDSRLHAVARRRSRLGLLTALDAARRPSTSRPQRGPRHRRRPSPPPVPRPTPVPP